MDRDRKDEILRKIMVVVDNQNTRYTKLLPGPNDPNKNKAKALQFFKKKYLEAINTALAKVPAGEAYLINKFKESSTAVDSLLAISPRAAYQTINSWVSPINLSEKDSLSLIFIAHFLNNTEVNLKMAEKMVSQP